MSERNIITSTKECYCHTCKKWFHWLGIARHRASHREKHEDCEITFTYGNRESYNYSKNGKSIRA